MADGHIKWGISKKHSFTKDRSKAGKTNTKPENCQYFPVPNQTASIKLNGTNTFLGQYCDMLNYHGSPRVSPASPGTLDVDEL